MDGAVGVGDGFPGAEVFEVVVGGREEVEVGGGGGAAELFIDGVVEVGVAGGAVAAGEAAGSIA
ncbi:hypothetical protein E3T31_09285 [Cryobacterium sp. TMS1-13-1]|nr:hypothetical protein E3T31_09285 [Cryobacterium sp. TMS1-13-1]